MSSRDHTTATLRRDRAGAGDLEACGQAEWAVGQALYDLSASGERLRATGDLDRRLQALAGGMLGRRVPISWVAAVRHAAAADGWIAVEGAASWVRPGYRPASITGTTTRAQLPVKLIAQLTPRCDQSVGVR